MKRSLLSEQKLVVVLFILVLITFVFAQADSVEMEKRLLRDIPAVSTSLDPSETSETVTEEKKVNTVIPAIQLR